MNFYENELIVARLGVRNRENPRGHIFVNPKRESDTLIFVIEGEVEISSGESRYPVGAGGSIYIPTGSSTRALHTGECNKTLIFFFDTVEGSLGEGITAFPLNSAALALAAEIFEELSREGALDTNYLRAAFYKLVWQITSDRAIDRKYLKMHSLMLELEAHYAENIPLAEYARRYLMSESSLRQLFREYTGKSVIRYRNTVRLRRARELIRDGVSVGEAALAVGFSSASFYCRLARKYNNEKG